MVKFLYLAIVKKVMGVNLTGIVPREEIGFEFLKNKSVGVDAYNAIYQFLSSIRGADGSYLMDSGGKVTSHLQGLLSRNLNLMAKGIKIVYVFDGEAPKLKYLERLRRADLKYSAEEKYKEALSAEDIDAMSKYSRQFMRLNEEMINGSKELVSALGIPVVQAPSEAEGQTAFMCKNGLLDFAASQDYDSILFGAPDLVRNLTLSQKRKVYGKTVYTFLEYIELKEVLKELGLNQEQLIVLGILVGTDFNVGGVKGVGPKKALKLVKENKNNFGVMFENLHIDFDWKEVYDIFSNLPVEKKIKLRWNEIDEEKIINILVEKHEFNEERVRGLIDKYKKENKNFNQKGLGEFI